MKREIKFRAWDTDGSMMKMFYDVTNILGLSYLMQFTGLRDKNGVDIYEGDIVTYKSFDMNITIQGVIVFGDGSFFIKSDVISAYRLMDYEIDVLGNIYENKMPS